MNDYALQAELAGLRVTLQLVKILHLLHKAGFRPDQPRWPAGRSDGGRWSGGADGGDGIVRDVARLAQLLRDAIPYANPSWGVNRLRKELNDQGFIFSKPTNAPGMLYIHPGTHAQVRIMERPSIVYRTDPPQKHFNDHYYRFRPRDDAKCGDPVPIPNK